MACGSIGTIATDDSCATARDNSQQQSGSESNRVSSNGRTMGSSALDGMEQAFAHRAWIETSCALQRRSMGIRWQKSYVAAVESLGRDRWGTRKVRNHCGIL
jgi:hypothetical protein